MERLLEIIELARAGDIKAAGKKLARLIAEMIIAMPENVSLKARFQTDYDAMSEKDLLDKVEKLAYEFGGEPTKLEGEKSESESDSRESLQDDPSRVIGDGTVINAFLPILLALLKKFLGV